MRKQALFRARRGRGLELLMGGIYAKYATMHVEELCKNVSNSRKFWYFTSEQTFNVQTTI